MNIHREGKNSILITLILVVFLGGLSYYFLYTWCILIIIPLCILLGLVIWFFRNPEKKFTFKDHEISAPVDGKIVEIKEVYEKEILKENCLMVSIFMSPLNVHVCRYPVSGKVNYTKYHPGKYLVAWHPKSSELNERTTLCITHSSKQKIAFRQIAGAVARRIVMYPKENDTAVAGQEFGFIKFGSRMDVYLPLETEILMKKGETTVGGKDILAKLKVG